MTEEQIIKALECLCGKEMACKECQYSMKYKYRVCQQNVATDALELINRQKATIDELTKAYKTLKSEKDAEIERLRDDKNRLEKMMDNLGKELDAEKIKNF